MTDAPAGIELVGLDADDTLWHSEVHFVEATETFAQILAPWTPEDEDVRALHEAVERRNLELFGYGIKGFVLSMVETALEASGNRVSGSAIAELLDLGRRMLTQPVELFDGVVEAVDALSERYRLVLVTKGDLIHQEQKIARSGLADRFERIEIVSEKDEATYRAVLDRAGVAPERFCMVGNAVRSDVLPVLAIGGHAAHVPYELTWVHELAEDHDADFPVLPDLAAFVEWLATAPDR